MKSSRDIINGSDSGNVDFIKENPEIAIPYLILISAFALGGTIGNGMVIASVLTYKVLKSDYVSILCTKICSNLFIILLYLVFKTIIFFSFLKPLRTIGNIFVVNLALADFSLTSFVDPFSIVGK